MTSTPTRIGELLGMAADADWVLYAPHPAYDEALIDNTFLFELTRQMGHWAPRARYVEAFVNTQGERSVWRTMLACTWSWRK